MNTGNNITNIPLPTLYRCLFICLFLLTGNIVAENAICGEPSIPRWQPYDFEFTTGTTHDNPFIVQFSGLLEGPQGTQHESLGFYDGNNTWKIRFAPTIEGSWTLTTSSKDPALDGRKISFLCTKNQNPNVHGSLVVDQKHPRHFVYADGARYYLMGYECDWLWALDMNNPALPSLNPFLDKLAGHGFNHIILNAFAYDASWREGKTGDDDYGPPPMYPWVGSNDQPVFDRFNLEFWRHYDRVVAALDQRGIIAHIMIKVYNKMVNWPMPGSAEDEMYFKWIVARYAAFSNVVWNFSKEAQNEKDFSYKMNRCRFIRNADPYNRLITVHDDGTVYDNDLYDRLLDFRSDQHHGNWHQTTLHQRSQRIWPVVNVEFGYEHGLKGIDDKTYGVVQSPEEVCRRAWEICLAGGYTAYYYTYTAWDVIRPEDTPPGYEYFKLMSDFFQKTAYWTLEPHDEFVSEGYCLANTGKEYIVFLNEAKPFTLTISGADGPLSAEWFNPFSGKTESAGTLSKGTQRLAPPSFWGKTPVALHVGAR